jgi:hypothetical protein
MLLSMAELSDVLPAIWHCEHPVSMHLIIQEFTQILTPIINDHKLTLPISLAIL